MLLAAEDTLVQTAQALGPLIRQHADEAERQRRPSRAVMQALGEAGLLRMYVPESLGGLELDPLTCARVVEEIAAHDSTAGWTLMVANAVDWWCARLPQAGVEEIYAAGPDVIIASAFHPPMRAIEVGGGYRVSGRSPLASNAHDAGWFLFMALVMDGDQPKLSGGAPEVVGAIFRAQECEIIDTWHALGLRGTDSSDVAVHDVFVPLERTFRVVPEFEPNPHYRSPLYRAPALAPALAPWVTIGLSIARGALTAFYALAEKKTPFASVAPLRERASAQARLGQAEALLRSARLLLYETMRAAWQRTLAGQPSTLEQKGELLLAGVHATHSAARAVELVYGAAGSSAIYTRSPLERHFRDIQVLKQHGFLSENRYETTAQIFLGLPPDLGLVVF